MNDFQFGQMLEQDRMSQAATEPIEGPAEGETWLHVDGDTVSIGEFGDYQTGSDFLYAEFRAYMKISKHPFEDLADDLGIDADDLFDMLLEGVDEQEIMDILVEAYDGQEG